MSAYTEQVLIDKLRLLSDSQQSIQTLSHWIMYHRKRHHTSVEIWKRELFKAPKDRRLLFLWLANDIVQTSKKKGNEFIKEFAKFLEPCVVFVYRDSNDKVKRQIGRMLDIWTERNIYAKDFIDTLKAQLLEKGDSTHATATPAGPSGEGGQIQMAFGKETAIAKAMRDLEEAAIAQDLSAEKVANLRTGLMDGRLLKQATHPKDIAALADEINEASHVLDQYRRSLESDLEKRGNFITMLTECIVQQENTMNQTTNVLQDCLQQLARVEELKNQIKSQYPSLPIPDRLRQPGTTSMGGTSSASSSTSSATATAATVGQQQQQQPHQQQQQQQHQHHQPTQLPYSFLPQQQQQQQQGSVTPTEEPPVDEEDDVILDASATNPYKKQKLFATAPAATSNPSSSSTPAYSAVLQPPLASPPPSSSSSSYAAPLSAPAGFNGALPPPVGQDHLQPLPYATAPPTDLHHHHHQQLHPHHPLQSPPQQWMPAPHQQQLHPHQHPHHHTHAHQPQPFADYDYDYDYSPPPH